MIYSGSQMNDYRSAKEACRFYDIHPATLLRWAALGKIKYKTGLGGRNRQYEIVQSKDISNKKPSGTGADV